MILANRKTQIHTSIKPLNNAEFNWISEFLHERTGIYLNDGKQAMVTGRLEKRLRSLDLNNYTDYFNLLGKLGEEAETRIAIDLLTTNETYFFRETQHFDYLSTHVFPKHPASKMLRIWSAASSSGEEAYTLAFLLSEHLPSDQWEILGTDISSRMLNKATAAMYPMSASEKIPQNLLLKYCLRGRDEFAGQFLINPALRKHVKFQSLNLMEPLPHLGQFDIIFLRNVMIYFEQQTRQAVIDRVQKLLIPGGLFIISCSESLNGLNTSLKMIMPSIYQKPL